MLLGLCGENRSPSSVHSGDSAAVFTRTGPRVPGGVGGAPTSAPGHSSAVAGGRSTLPPTTSDVSLDRTSLMSPEGRRRSGGMASPLAVPPLSASSVASSLHRGGGAGLPTPMHVGGMGALGSPAFPGSFWPPMMPSAPLNMTAVPGFAGLATGSAGMPPASVPFSPQDVSLTAAAAEAGISPADLLAVAQALKARQASLQFAQTAKALTFTAPDAPPSTTATQNTAKRRRSGAASDAGSSQSGARAKAPRRRSSASHPAVQRFATTVNRRSDFRVPVEAVLRFQGAKVFQTASRGVYVSATADARVMDGDLRVALLAVTPPAPPSSPPRPTPADATHPPPKASPTSTGSDCAASDAGSVTSEGLGTSLRNGVMGLPERDPASTPPAVLEADASVLVQRIVLASGLPGEVFGAERLAELRGAGVTPCTSRSNVDERGLEMYSLGKQLWLAWTQLHCLKPFPSPYLSALMRHVTAFTRRNEVDLFRNYRRRHLAGVLDAVREAAAVTGVRVVSPNGKGTGMTPGLASGGGRGSKRPREV